ncbi:polysaccharide biosynthesis protein [Parasulfitobacter algicola]|uniref:Polysaccharide biosynthesis protein n=1 Tax=Parasulfitobacter algicola TaxID=2614809 RepID=A0ABX2ILH5_9RHOB|nr:nucleoside-diphosphate sugar epimerase/dehydratase [Sulfitobacter algicola]NSX53240.1 polysaccharide biosynthesis protein [Sulfitobacter algicola]
MLRFINSLSQRQKSIILLGLDIFLVPIAVVCTILLHADLLSPLSRYSSMWPLLPLLMLSAGLIAQTTGIARTMLNAYAVSAFLHTALFAISLSVIAFLLSLLSAVDTPVTVFVSFAINFFLLSAGSRLILIQIMMALYRVNEPVRRVLVYGAGRTGIQLVTALRRHPRLQPVAFADDNAALADLTVKGLPVFRTANLENTIQEMKIQRVILAVPSLSDAKSNQLTKRIERLGIDVQALPSFAQLTGEEVPFDQLSPLRISNLLGREPQENKSATVCEDYKNKSVLITGAGGTIGSELCRQILDCKPRRIVLFDLSELGLYTIQQELLALKSAENTVEIVPILGSITNEILVQKSLQMHKIDVILHAAAYKHVPLVEHNPIIGLQNNVLGTAVLASAAHKYGVQRFVLISSDKAVRPANIMGASKRFSELIVQDLATRAKATTFSIVRFGNVMGSSGSVLPLFEDQISRGGPVTVTHPDITRYFMTSQEAVKLVLKAGHFAKGGDVFVLDMGKPVRILDVAHQMILATGYSVKTKDNPHGDIEIMFTGLRPGEKLHEELMVNAGDQITLHDKIFRVREAYLSELEMARALRMLSDAISENNADQARAVLTDWIYGYSFAAQKAGS